MLQYNNNNNTNLGPNYINGKIKPYPLLDLVNESRERERDKPNGDYKDYGGNWPNLSILLATTQLVAIQVPTFIFGFFLRFIQALHCLP